MATTPVNITGATTMVGFTITPPFSQGDVYTFSFPYISQDDFEITVNSETVLDPSEYEFTSSYLIQLTETGVTNLNTLYGDLDEVSLIIRRRTTLSSRLVDFRDASTLTEEDLDLSAVQLFYLIQEIYDTAEIGNVEFNPIDGSIDFNDVVMVNVGYPTGETAAATLGSVLDNVVTPNYTEGDTYRQYRMVFNGGNLYRANVDIASAPAIFDTDDWDVVLTAAQLTQIATNTADIEAVEGDVATLQSDVSALESDVTTLQSDLNTDEDALATHIAENATAHTQRDTKANLDTWAVGKTNGSQAYATDLKTAYIVRDSVLVPFGAGGGGLDVLYTDDFENAEAFVTGNGTLAAAGGGSFSGTLSDDTTTEISGDQSLKYVMGGSSTADFFLNDADIAIQEKQTNNWLGFNFWYQYNGSDNDIRFVVLDQDDTELTSSIEYIKAASTATRFSTAVYIPDAVTGIRYGWKVVTGNSAKIFIIDDLEVSTNPFTYKNLSNSTGWVSYTPTLTGFGTPTGVDFQYRLTETDVLVRGRFVSGTPTGVEARASLPTGITTLSTLSAALSSIGTYFRNGAGGTTANKGGGLLVEPSKTYFTFTTSALFNSSTVNWDISANGDAIVGVSDEITFNVRIPVDGRSATSEHVVTPAANNINSVTLSGSDSRAITATTESIYWSGSGTGWTTGVDGSTTTNGNYYTVQANNSIINLQGSTDNSGGGYGGSIRLYKNGVSYKMLAENTADRSRTFNFTSKKGEFVAGDKLSFVSTANITVNNTSVDHYLNINEYMDAKLLSAVPITQVAYLKEIQASGTAGHAGATFNSGSYTTRFLNTLEGDNFVSLSSNQFTLPAGKYMIEARSQCKDVNTNKIKLRNITDSSDAIIGIGGYTGAQNESELMGMIELTASKTFELQHRCSTTRATDGFGAAASYGDSEVYSIVKITKLR